MLSDVDILKQQNFMVNQIMADSERKLISCTNDLNWESIEFVVLATGEHVSERAIKVIKDRAKSIIA